MALAGEYDGAPERDERLGSLMQAAHRQAARAIVGRADIGVPPGKMIVSRRIGA
jgi:hypothetical protein